MCDRASFWYNDVNNQQDATTFSFINLFNSALHVSGNKFAHHQELFLSIYSFWYNAPTLLPTGRQQCRCISGVPRNFVPGGGVSTNSVEDRGQRERGSGGGSPLVGGFGGSCNLVQEISFHVVS